MALKIATIAPSFYPAHSYGGPIRSTLQLAQGLVRAGCEVRVLTTDTASRTHTLDVDTTRERVLPGNVRVRYAHRLLPESVSPKLLALLPEYVAWSDVVHLVGSYNFPTFPTLLAARVADKPLYWSPRGSLQRWQHARKPQLKAAFERICGVLLPRTTILHVTSSDEGEQSSRRLGGLPFVVIPNGVPIPEHIQREPTHGPLRIAFLGRLDPKKALPNLLQACACLPGLGVPDYELTVAGSGAPAYVKSLHEQARSLGMSARVRFLGEIRDQDKAQFFSHADLLVMPSFTENFGIVAAEALAHAVPVVASRATPWSELETHDCGLWVDNQPRSLADAIVTLSRRNLRELGERGRALVMRAYSWDSLSDRMKASYETTLAAHQAGRSGRDQDWI